MDDSTRATGASIVAWIALIVSVLALILGWVAFNRTGEDLENQIQRQVDQTINNTEREAPAPGTTDNESGGDTNETETEAQQQE